MQFSVNKDINFDQAVELMFEKLGDWKIMALASSVNDYVMVRNVSCLFYDGKVWFKTDKNFRKTQQLFQNPQVALCWSGVQIEGIAENKGLVVDEPDRRFDQIKQAMTGYGRADKKQIQEMVRVYLGLQKVPKPDDAADALAVALTHIQTGGFSDKFSIK